MFHLELYDRLHPLGIAAKDEEMFQSGLGTDVIYCTFLFYVIFVANLEFHYPDRKSTSKTDIRS